MEAFYFEIICHIFIASAAARATLFVAFFICMSLKTKTSTPPNIEMWFCIKQEVERGWQPRAPGRKGVKTLDCSQSLIHMLKNFQRLLLNLDWLVQTNSDTVQTIFLSLY